MAFSIGVLIKQTPDLNAVRVDKTTGKAIIGDQLVLGSADAIAVEAALRLKEAHGGQVTVISAGPASTKDSVQRALAMGADRGIILAIDRVNEIDTLALARALSPVISQNGFDIVLAGQQSDDYETGQVAAQVAELTGLPQVSWVTALESDGTRLTMERDTEDGKQQVQSGTPVLVMVADGLNEPRLPSLKGIMAAKKKPVETLAVDIAAGNAISWSEPVAQQKAAGGIIVQDKPAAEAVAELVSWLKSNKLV